MKTVRGFEYVGEVIYTTPITSKTASVICPGCEGRVHFELIEGRTTHLVICPKCAAVEGQSCA